MKKDDNKRKVDREKFSLVTGGLIYSATSFLRGEYGDKKGLIRTAIALALVCWVPVCILAVLGGTLHDSSDTIDFFEDFLFHARYLVAVPFLILIEKTVDIALNGYLRQSECMIPEKLKPKFEVLVLKLDRLTNSHIPEIIALVFFYLIAFLNWDDLWLFDSGRNYLSIPGTDVLNAAGWYYILVASPIFQLVMFRWMWRLMIWIYSLISLSRFKLLTDPLHADQMAGLEFLNIVPLMFSKILFVLSFVLSAYIGIEIIYHGASLKEFIFHISLYVFFLPLLLYAPLIVFMPYLIRAKAFGIQVFGELLRMHNEAYLDKWIQGNNPENEPLLGSVDHSSLADLNGSYAPVSEMKIAPINMKSVVQSFAINVIPFLPLWFSLYSGKEIFQHVFHSLVGG